MNEIVGETGEAGEGCLMLLAASVVLPVVGFMAWVVIFL